ncbi:MAG: sulfatase-like hydrolase/transferase [Mangrovibacterium sp.]
MKESYIVILGILLFMKSVVVAKVSERPNFVVIMCDDVSYDMFGCYGNRDTHTPNIDKLAENGVMFKNAWNSALCTPARAEIMTGCYATKTGVWHNFLSFPQADGTDDLFKYYPAFSKILKDNGYQTAVAGKWHVGGAQHQDHPLLGFDEYCMWEDVAEFQKITGKNEWTGGVEIPSIESDDTSYVKTARYWHPCIIQNHKWIETKPTDFGPDIFCKFICDFIKRATAKDQPFLAYYPMTLPHGPYVEMPTKTKQGSNNPKEDSKISNKKRFGEMVNYVDILVGRIMTTLEESGELENTIVIFTADNGTAVTAKGRGVERGSHIPFIMAGKSIKKRGITNEITDATDVLPTLVDLADAKYPKNFKCDGKSLKDFVQGKKETHRDVIHACIGTTQLLRTREHLLEVVNPVLGIPAGRFYYCGDSNDGSTYVRAEHDNSHLKIYDKLRKLLDKKYAGIKKDHPYFRTEKGKQFMKNYTKKAEIQKHIHNHKDYQNDDESVELDETTMWKLND